MENENSYYGTEAHHAISYLEFGSINPMERTKKIWGYWQDQEAYDLYMFARYARDLFAFRHFLCDGEKNVVSLLRTIENSAHVKLLDYIFKYAGVVSQGDNTGMICESGSSLFGMIEEILACDAVFHDGKHFDQILKAKYLASDISDMMNEGAIALHPHTPIESTTASTIHQLIKEIKASSLRLNIFYGLGVSVRYAIRSSRDIIDMTDVCDFQMYNRLSLSYADTLTSVYGTGKTVYIISLDELIEGLNKKKVIAKFCTANMQYEKDGYNTVRASVIIGRTEKDLERYITEYNTCIDLIASTESIDKGEWRALSELRKC